LTTCCEGDRLRSTSCPSRGADAVNEGLDDLEIDVGLEEREPDLAQRGFDQVLP